MRQQLQGIALILFGILLMLVSIADPWVPIIADVSHLSLIAGVTCGIAGLVFVFGKEQ